MMPSGHRQKQLGYGIDNSVQKVQSSIFLPLNIFIYWVQIAKIHKDYFLLPPKCINTMKYISINMNFH